MVACNLLCEFILGTFGIRATLKVKVCVCLGGGGGGGGGREGGDNNKYNVSPAIYLTSSYLLRTSVNANIIIISNYMDNVT